MEMPRSDLLEGAGVRELECPRSPPRGLLGSEGLEGVGCGQRAEKLR